MVSIQNHHGGFGSRHVCVERYDTGRSVYKHGSRHVCEV